MSRSWIASALVSMAVVVPQAAAAQDSLGLSQLQIALGCAPPPRITPPVATALRVAGAQDTVPRDTFGGKDMLVIAGGTNAGAAPGQRYFLRRLQSYGGISLDKGVPHITQTTGWVQIVSANETTSLATIEHACGVITGGDTLEPFTAPVVPATLAEKQPPLGELDFSSPGRVLFGDEERSTLGIGEFAVIDLGSNTGATTGTRLAIYRDLHQPDVPLVALGEAVVVSDAADAAVIRIVRARDAVFAGDLLIREKK